MVYANVLKSSYIYRINPLTGEVDEIIDCTSLVQIAQPTHPDDVLNGIAHDSSSGHFYLTGKRWPVIFEVVLATTSGG
jgi:glutamine cyclotransferase